MHAERLAELIKTLQNDPAPLQMRAPHAALLRKLAWATGAADPGNLWPENTDHHAERLIANHLWLDRPQASALFNVHTWGGHNDLDNSCYNVTLVDQEALIFVLRLLANTAIVDWAAWFGGQATATDSSDWPN
jgi:hypothetical protein